MPVSFFFRSRSFSILPFCNHSRCNINGIALFAMQLFQQKHHHHPVFLVHKPSPICLAICVYMDFYCCCVCNFFSFFVYFFFLLFSVASVQFPTCTDYNITYAPVVCSTFSRLVFNFSGVSVLLLTDNDCRCIAPCACLHIHNE